MRETPDGVAYAVQEIGSEQLSEGDVLIAVDYSSINYKDMLAVKKNGGVIRRYPMILGIDLSGTVVSSRSSAPHPGQNVPVTGFDVGMTHTSGYAEFARIPAQWVFPLPEGLTAREAMIIGTAGFTAALSIDALERMGMYPGAEQAILVTGASGGVGSVALRLLKKSGYINVTAMSRKKRAGSRYAHCSRRQRSVVPGRTSALRRGEAPPPG